MTISNDYFQSALPLVDKCSGWWAAASRSSDFENPAEGTCRQRLPGYIYTIISSLSLSLSLSLLNLFPFPPLLLCRWIAAPWARATKQGPTRPASKKHRGAGGSRWRRAGKDKKQMEWDWSEKEGEEGRKRRRREREGGIISVTYHICSPVLSRNYL